MLHTFSRLLPYAVLFYTASFPPLYAGKVEIRLPGLQNKCLDVAGAGTADGTKVQLWTCNGTAAQQFELVDVATTTPPPKNPPPTGEGQCSNTALWVAGKQYKPGDKVYHEKQLFTAKHENPGYNPKISTWFWEAGSMCYDTPPPTTTNPPPVTTTPPPAGTPTGDKHINFYYQSWSESWSSSGANLGLAKVPSWVKTINLSFVKPDMQYRAGQNSFVGTGMDFSSDFSVVKEAVAIARSKGQNVSVSVGGATYTNWNAYNAEAVVAFAKDIGANQIDIDGEDMNQMCGWATGAAKSCPGDENYISVIRRTRALWPRPLILSAAAWSTGAFGEAPYETSKFKGNLVGNLFGSFINPLKQVGDQIDLVTIMSYDAGGPNAPEGNPTGYDWRQALAAYQRIYKGRILLGSEPAPEAWGSFVSDEADVRARAKATNGLMIWSYQKPNGKQFGQYACRELALANCDNIGALPATESNPKKVNEVKRSMFQNALETR